ncbi:GNAT family N-acetyltransferase [Blastococcus sp. LR1]|uniref:GNAT family N-acetyltransferase n=1 Tax=Blastococcus sp. LR1 TaxID=2877000 RepID=UPI001CCB8BDD|nr:GNAT family N-acetyltransferase [Blastococcus sp. LR1]MCA0144466.1 GNAT family N-acetyltransferase [Blastococcus sp. LR1]
MGEFFGGGLLFGRPGFHDLNGVPEGSRWRYVHRDGDRLVGVLEGVVTDGELLSGHSAPFGGPDWARADPTLDDVLGLVDGAVAAARADGLRTLRVRCRPGEYSPAEPLLEYALHRAGARVELCGLNHTVDLRPLAAGADPLELLGKKRARDVRADQGLPYALVDADDDDLLAACTDVLEANRSAHGRPPGLSASYLSRASAAFPGSIRACLLRHDGRDVAAAVVYRVLDDVDLLVAWGDRPDHGLQRSPMNLLAHLLVQRSVEGGARLLDLGPSSEHDGSPNRGLAQFKRSVGAVPGTRKVLVASLGSKGVAA